MKLVLFIFICIFISFIISCSTETTTSGSINWWCTKTPHYETCNHYIVSQKRRLSLAILSINQFRDITVQAAINEAQVTLKRAQGIESTYPNVPGKSLWGSCVDYFDGIVFTLNMVLDHTLEQTPLDAQTWLSAGLSYINMCEKGFELINMSNTILSTISTNLTELILNSLAISVVIRSSDTPDFVDLNYSNKHMLSNLAVENPDVVVALDGSGNFTSIQEAVDSAGSRRRRKKYVIYVKAGVYQEYVEIQHKVRDIKMFGDGINKTIITGNRHAGGDTLATPKAGDLKESATFKVYGRGFIARDITFQNTAGPDGGQALALLAGSDQSAFYRCSFEGYQDTLLTQDSKQFYKECQIYGTVDFIFGDARAVFQDCEIFLRKPHPGGGLVVTAHGRKYHNQTGGYSFQGCNITAADDLKPVIRQYKKAFLGRPWFAYARTVFIQCFLDDLVDPKGWLDSWGHNKTAYCGEYENNGKGASTHKRVQWPNYQVITDPKIAEHFTVVHLISGNRWLPATSVPYISGLEKLYKIKSNL